jgi:hypothetical protein
MVGTHNHGFYESVFQDTSWIRLVQNMYRVVLVGIRYAS